MRSGRPGPVLIDLPFDVQMAEIEFDPDTYEPLPVYKPAATRAQVEKALDMLAAAERPLIVAGGGIINADAVRPAGRVRRDSLDVPVIPTLMGWGTIPDDHPLMAGMVGLQTSHRYGNATMLESDFVLGIGNRWANRHTGGLDVYRAGRTFVHVDIEPTQIGRVFAPDYGIVSDAKAALELFVAVAQRAARPPATLPDRSVVGRGLPRAQAHAAAPTHFDNVPIKPQRVYEEMNQAFGRDTRYVTHHRPVADRRRAVPARLQAAALDQLRPGRPAGLDASRRRSASCAADPDATVVALSGDYDFQFMIEELAVGRAVQPALHPRRGEQLLPRPDPAVAARLRHGLLRAAGVRQRQLPRARAATASTTSRSPKAWAARRSGSSSRTSCRTAFEQAKKLMAEFRVPVVVEVILERVTNISMGTELDNVTEFEDLAAARRGRADGRSVDAGLRHTRRHDADAARQRLTGTSSSPPTSSRAR